MSYELFFSGAGATLLGTLVGVWLGSHLTARFQQRLLDQQLEFQKKQGEADALQRKEIARELIVVMESARAVLRDLTNIVASLNLNYANDLVKRAKQENQK